MSITRRIPLDARLRRLTVSRVTELSASMRRVELGGTDLADFECFGPTDHAKVFFPTEPGGTPALPELTDGRFTDRQDPRYVCRDYTVRTWVPGTGTLVLDMATHDHGPAGRWAAAAEPGHELGVYGPKTSKIPPTDRAWYVLAADETGLPALTNWLERLPADAVVHALAEVGGTADEVPLPDGARVTWLHRGDAPAGTTTLLADAVAGLDIGPAHGPGWVWAGAEAGVVHGLRRAVADHGIERSSCSMTGYWRRGVANFDHKSADAQG
jgi:NADPH-dependent ferric siderophore reductase